MNRKTVFSVAAVIGTVGCATVKVPPEKFEQTQASLRGAEEVGAYNIPTAKLHLQYAKDQEATAKKLSEAGDKRAELVLARANADSELAIALAREEAARKEADKAAEDLQNLQRNSTP